ncbi:MAG: hypothetical protein QOI54_2206 [Actinomycetota bacterium]|jgi:hypothetical protein|nr:hypothetical protein [Actinomycetota bacterium]
MGSREATHELREELRSVDGLLAQLRQEVAEARRRIAEEWDMPGDEADVSAALTLVEEQEAVIATLEERREVILDELGDREG